MTSDSPAAPGRGCFFKVCRHCFARAATLGLNPATAYLVLACGGRVTSWSTHAVERYAGIGRTRAWRAIQELARVGLIRFEPCDSRHPRYRIARATELPKPDPAAGSWPVWLPNTIVTGAAGEKSAIALVREIQDVRVLQLLVDLYAEQDLAGDCGIHWRQIRESFERQRLAQFASWNIWAFAPKCAAEAWTSTPFVRPFLTGKEEPGPDGKSRDPGWSEFWSAWRELRRLGLVQIVPHLVESDTNEAEVIHAFDLHGDGDPIERDVADAATDAAQRMLRHIGKPEIRDEDLIIAPVREHFRDVAMVGIARLRYRAWTSRTAAWEAKRRGLVELASQYDQLCREHATSRKIKGIKGDQG